MIVIGSCGVSQRASIVALAFLSAAGRFRRILGRHVYTLSPKESSGGQHPGLTSDALTTPLLEQSVRLVDAQSDAG